MVEAKKIALGLFGVYLVILANISIVDGDIGATTTDPLVSGDDVTTITEEAIWNQMDDVVTEESSGALNVDGTEPEMSTPGGVDCVCDCNDQVRDCLTVDECVTTAQEQIQTSDTHIANGEASSTAEATMETTTAGVVDEATTNITTEDKDTTTGAPNTSTATAPPRCSTPGVEPDESNCHAYHDCSSAGASDGSYHSVTKSCAANEAFSVEFGRCSRDISSCKTDVVCQFKGGIADPSTNNSYYWCEPRLIGSGFRVFHVKCSAIEVFYPGLGKCFIDMKNLPQQPYPAFPPYNWNQIEDIDIVKAEMKLIKEQDKLKLKAEKDRVKAENKLQKEIQKQAEQRAKEEDKFKKAQAKQESASFMCPQEGNFASSVSETIYYMCVSKKDKFKVATMQCPIGSKFNVDVGTCSIANPGINNDTDNDDEY